MIKTWTPGCDEIIKIFEDHRATQLDIAKQADRLASCHTRETARFCDTVISAAERVPSLQRLIERIEAIEEVINQDCVTAAGQLDKLMPYYDSLTDPRHRAIIRIFYIYALPMEVAAAKVKYCKRWCLELRDDAIRVMTEKCSPDFTANCDTL